MPYNRPWLSYQQQLEQLKQRGMLVTDDNAALDYLERIGYIWLNMARTCQFGLRWKYSILVPYRS